MDRLNVLMILADQHHAGLLGCAGHEQVLTPNLDAFASSGVRFTDAYCQNTICTPSRVSILSGQYCHNHGYYGLSGPANPRLDNFMRRFRAAGYRTAGFGKLHLPDSPRNWIADDLDYFGDTYESADGVTGTSEFLLGLEELGLRDLEDSWHNDKEYGAGSISMDAMPSKLPYEHTQEMWCARKAMEFIDAGGDTPFCIQVAFQKPHHPLLPNRRFWDLYPADLNLPATFHREPAQRPPHFRAGWERFRSIRWDYGGPGEPFEEGARRAWRGTLACVSQIDDVFGTLLGFLDDRGLTDSTIVVYGSDHGCYHGIHGIPEKAPGICSDAVCRVPMLWRVPGITKEGTVREAFVENVDMAPTLTSLCGIGPFECADGSDITPLLDGSLSSVRDAAVTENPFSKSIRWDGWRLVHYQPEMFDGQDVGELYRIDEDPDELENLYADPGHGETVETGRRLLLEWLIRTTRIVTTHPAVRSGEPRAGRHEYPLCTDGRAPNPVQPRYRNDGGINYL